MNRSLTFVLPGDIDTRTGGYGYDRQIIAGLRALGWHVDVRSLPPVFPFPDAEARAAARAAFAAIPDGRLVIVDGLAFGALPELAEAEAERLALVALVHHPLALETGLGEDQARSLYASERRALATTRAVIVTSRATALQLAEYGVAAGRITVIEPGTAPQPVAAGGSGAPLGLLCVATLTPRKGHAVLFAALAQLRTYDWHLTCVGGAPAGADIRSRLDARQRELGLAGRVTFAGEGDDAFVSQAYAAADVFVLPTWYEGYGMVVAEALAHGLPVIASNTGAIADLVGDSAGIVVPPGDVAALRDALVRVMADPGHRATLRAGALAARSRLPTWQHSAARLSQRLGEISTS